MEKVRGVQAIVDEIAAWGTETDKECLDYILHQEAGSGHQTFQNGLKRDCGADGEVLPERTVPDGQGGMRPMRLADFVSRSCTTQSEQRNTNPSGANTACRNRRHR